MLYKLLDYKNGWKLISYYLLACRSGYVNIITVYIIK